MLQKLLRKPPPAAPGHTLIEQVQEEDLQIPGKPESPETDEGPHLRRIGDGAAYTALALSITGIALIAILLFSSSPTISRREANLYIWGIFSTLTLIGASATLLPHRCGHAAARTEALDSSRTSTFLGVSIVHGHHPHCGEFQGHEFTVEGKTYCAGCVGLLFGSFTAIAIATLYFIYGFKYHPAVASIGLGLVTLGLTHVPMLRTSRPLLRSTFNAGLVTGFSLILTVSNEVGGPGLDLIVIGMCLFWMFTRIQLSNWDHEKICLKCGYKCAMEDEA